MSRSVESRGLDFVSALCELSEFSRCNRLARLGLYPCKVEIRGRIPH